MTLLAVGWTKALGILLVGALGALGYYFWVLGCTSIEQSGRNALVVFGLASVGVILILALG